MADLSTSTTKKEKKKKENSNPFHKKWTQLFGNILSDKRPELNYNIF